MATDKLIKELSVAGGLNRRSFLTGATMFSVGAAAMAIVDGCSGGSMMKTTPSVPQAPQIPQPIF